MSGFFGHQRFVHFHLCDLRLEAFACGRVARRHDQLDEFVDFVVQTTNLGVCGSFCADGLVTPCVPDFAEHGGGHGHHVWRGLKLLDYGCNISFQRVSLDRFAIVFAGFGLAEVVGVNTAIAAREGRAEGHVTARAAHNAAQGELVADVGSLGGFGHAVAAILDFAEGLQRDDGIVLRFQPVNAIVLRADVTGVNRVGQDVGNPLLRELAILQTGKIWRGFQKALYLGLRLEATQCIAFKCLADHTVPGHIRHQHFAPAFDGHVFEAHRAAMHEVAVLHPRFHLLARLAGVLFALQLTRRCDHDLVELALGRIHEVEVEALTHSVTRVHLAFELEVELDIAGVALEIIKNNDKLLIRMGIQEGQECDHAGAFHKIATA